jgi:hypothetical protein
MTALAPLTAAPPYLPKCLSWVWSCQPSLRLGMTSGTHQGPGSVSSHCLDTILELSSDHCQRNERSSEDLLKTWVPVTLTIRLMFLLSNCGLLPRVLHSHVPWRISLGNTLQNSTLLNEIFLVLPYI